MRNTYLACYDVADPKRWRTVHRLMLAYGEPLQLSVFICCLTDVELAEMRTRVLTALNRAEDAFAVAHLGREESARVDTYGLTRWLKGRRVVV
jgi:CRISPR-associated protein Cas2